MNRSLLVVLFFTCLASAQQPASEEAELVKAIDLVAAGNHATAIPILERMTVGSPREEVYFHLGTAYLRAKNAAKAAGAFADGASKYPLSARLHNAAGLAYEEQFDLPKSLAHYRKASALDPTIAYTGGGRFDPDFNAIYIPLVHDHRGANSCSGRLYVDEKKMHFVVYLVYSGWGLGSDDSFEVPYADIDFVEVDRKKGQQAIDYSIITLLTNLSGPRRRIASGEEARVDLKFTFKQPIKGYRGNPWTKPEIKFFFIEPELGDRFLNFLKSRDIKTSTRD